jgi:hypothetical protein
MSKKPHRLSGSRTFTHDPDTRKRQRSWFTRAMVLMLVIVAAIAVCFVLGISLTGTPRFVDGVAAYVARIKTYAVIIQCTAIALLWWYWHAIIDMLLRTGRIGSPLHNNLMVARNRIVLALVAVEVLVVIGFPLRYL